MSLDALALRKSQFRRYRRDAVVIPPHLMESGRRGILRRALSNIPDKVCQSFMSFFPSGEDHRPHGLGWRLFGIAAIASLLLVGMSFALPGSSLAAELAARPTFSQAPSLAARPAAEDDEDEADVPTAPAQPAASQTSEVDADQTADTGPASEPAPQPGPVAAPSATPKTPKSTPTPKPAPAANPAPAQPAEVAAPKATPTPAATKPTSTTAPGGVAAAAVNLANGGGSGLQASGVGASTLTQFRVTGTEGEGLRVRTVPSLIAPIVSRLTEGTTIVLAEGVAVEADSERWLPVVANQTKGWVAARFLVRTVSLAPTIRSLPANASFADRVTALAEANVGQPYVWGGSLPGGFDCSGFVQYVYGKMGVQLPRTVAEQIGVGKKVDLAGLRPGDLVFFSNTYTAGLSHIGIYLGNNQFVHAADEARGVTVSNMQDDYWKPRFFSATRLKT